jgi:hypothetical protein
MTNVEQYTAGEALRTGDLLELRPDDGRVYRHVPFPSRWERLLRGLHLHAVPVVVGGAGRDVHQGETLPIVRGPMVIKEERTHV